MILRRIPETGSWPLRNFYGSGMGLFVVFSSLLIIYICIATAFRRGGLQSAPVTCEGKRKLLPLQFFTLFSEDGRAYPGIGCDASQNLRRLHQNNTGAVLKRSSLVAHYTER